MNLIETVKKLVDELRKPFELTRGGYYLRLLADLFDSSINVFELIRSKPVIGDSEESLSHVADAELATRIESALAEQNGTTQFNPLFQALLVELVKRLINRVIK